MKRENKDLQDSIIIAIEENIKLNRETSSLILSKHNWLRDGKKDNEVLDVYLEVLGNEEEFKKYLSRAKRIKKESSLEKLAYEYKDFFDTAAFCLEFLALSIKKI